MPTSVSACAPSSSLRAVPMPRIVSKTPPSPRKPSSASMASGVSASSPAEAPPSPQAPPGPDRPRSRRSPTGSRPPAGSCRCWPMPTPKSAPSRSGRFPKRRCPATNCPWVSSSWIPRRGCGLSPRSRPPASKPSRTCRPSSRCCKRTPTPIRCSATPVPSPSTAFVVRLPPSMRWPSTTTPPYVSPPSSRCVAGSIPRSPVSSAIRRTASRTKPSAPSTTSGSRPADPRSRPSSTTVPGANGRPSCCVV